MVYRIAGHFRMVEIFVLFILKSIIRKLNLTKISLHNNVNNYVRHYAELYEYLGSLYENLKITCYTVLRMLRIVVSL